MKTKSILATALMLAAAAGASAQNQLVKDQEQALKKVGNYQEYIQAVQALQPAFSNPETAEQAKTYFVPGKAGFDLYDNYFTAASLGQQVNTDDMGKALLDGYDYFMMAFKYDSLPDAKGKVKPKYSKDMVNIIVGHVNDFDRAAVGFWQAQDFQNAYRAWEALLQIPSDPRYAKSNIKPFADSIAAQIRFNQALAAWQAQDLDGALAAFEKSFALGNDNPEAYEYAYSVAYQAKKPELCTKIARAGYDKFGTQDPKFIQWTVNSYINDKDYDSATKMLSEAMESDPDNPLYQYSFGILNEAQEKMPEAQAAYRKAIELNPQFAAAYLNLGRTLAEQYDALDQATGNMAQAEYNKYAAETLNPLLKEAAENFETAYAVDNNLTDALKYLKNIYYRLGDETNRARVASLLGEE